MVFEISAEISGCEVNMCATLDWNNRRRMAESTDRTIAHIIPIVENIFAFPGFPAPRLFPTKLDMANDIPNANIYRKAIIFKIITLAPNSLTPSNPDNIIRVSKHQNSRMHMTIEGSPYFMYSISPTNESLLMKWKEFSFTIDRLITMYRMDRIKLREFEIPVAIAIPYMLQSK